jgi:hypothetical protein
VFKKKIFATNRTNGHKFRGIRVNSSHSWLISFSESLYNYLLKCFVLIDLKVGKLTHQDIGQMDSYVRMFDEHARPDGDNPTIGLILCSKKNEAIARYSVLSEGKRLFAAKYVKILPSEVELQREIERERRLIEARQGIVELLAERKHRDSTQQPNRDYLFSCAPDE